LRGHGVRCMVGVSPTHDQLESAGERARVYKEEIAKRPDIIETDLPVELFEIVKSM